MSNAALSRKFRAQTSHTTNPEDSGLNDHTNSAHGISPEYHLQMQNGLAKLEKSIQTSTEALSALLLHVPGYTGTPMEVDSDDETPSSDPFTTMAMQVAKILAKKLPPSKGNVSIYTDKVNQVFVETFEKYMKQVTRLSQLVQNNSNELATLKALFYKSKAEAYAWRRVYAAQNLQFMHDYSFHHLDMMYASSKHMNKVDKFFDEQQAAASEKGEEKDPEDAMSRLQALDKIDIKTGKRRKSTRGRGRGRGGLTRESENQ